MSSVCVQRSYAMMEEAVNVLYDRMKLMEIEDEEIMVDLEPLKNLSKRKQFLLVKLLTTRPYNREAFKLTMKKI